MLALYDYYRSSACYRVRIALYLKQLDFEAIPIHLINNGGEQYSEEYKTINPQSLVPSLKVDDKILTQSLAIIEYLDELHPAPALLPTDPFHKALIRSFALSIAADIHPLNNSRVLKYLVTDMHLSESQKNGWYQHWIGLGLAALEKQLQKHKLANNFCFGDEPTLADVCLIPQLYNAKRFAVDLSAYPTLVRIDEHCQTLMAFKRALPNAA